ncbi:MAG: DivIVA domain-containing protein [Propionibacteriaceae bacterium]|nr:DivIVA domain-containing protein [Propionibacteriaceae bacterium]
MTLNLEEVRSVRFRMAKPRVSGYDVVEVDTFIDKVEEAFSQFENERERLRREVQSSSDVVESVATDADPQEVAAKDSEIASLRAEVDRLKGEAAASQDGDERSQRLSGQVDQLTVQNDELRAELARVRAELDEVRTQRVNEVIGQVQTLTVGTRDDASPAVIRLVQLATEQAEMVVEEAETEANRKLADAKQQSHEITTDAAAKAEHLETEARLNAEQTTEEAEERANQLDQETKQRRSELFANLEREQVELAGKVDALREFETSYRDNLKSYLSFHLEALDDDSPEPAKVPELAQRRESDTPRLDALAQGNDA